MSEQSTIGKSSQSPEALLTLREVCERLGVDYEFLRPYASLPELRAHVGARDKKGTRGVGFPAESLAVFAQIVEDVQANRVTLKTLPAHLNALHIVPAARQPGSLARQGGEAVESAIVALSHFPVSELIAAIGALSHLPAALAALPAPDDELLSVKDAAARYGVSPSVLRGLRVKDGGRLKVRKSDVLKYIAGL